MNTTNFKKELNKMKNKVSFKEYLRFTDKEYDKFLSNLTDMALKDKDFINDLIKNGISIDEEVVNIMKEEFSCIYDEILEAMLKEQPFLNLIPLIGGEDLNELKKMFMSKDLINEIINGKSAISDINVEKFSEKYKASKGYIKSSTETEHKCTCGSTKCDGTCTCEKEKKEEKEMKVEKIEKKIVNVSIMHDAEVSLNGNVLTFNCSDGTEYNIKFCCGWECVADVIKKPTIEVEDKEKSVADDLYLKISLSVGKYVIAGKKQLNLLEQYYNVKPSDTLFDKLIIPNDFEEDYFDIV